MIVFMMVSVFATDEVKEDSINGFYMCDTFVHSSIQDKGSWQSIVSVYVQVDTEKEKRKFEVRNQYISGPVEGRANDKQYNMNYQTGKHFKELASYENVKFFDAQSKMMKFSDEVFPGLFPEDEGYSEGFKCYGKKLPDWVKADYLKKDYIEELHRELFIVSQGFDKTATKFEEYSGMNDGIPASQKWNKNLIELFENMEVGDPQTQPKYLEVDWSLRSMKDGQAQASNYLDVIKAANKRKFKQKTDVDTVTEEEFILEQNDGYDTGTYVIAEPILSDSSFCSSINSSSVTVSTSVFCLNFRLFAAFMTSR
jgi:hypothetical protein